jgi:hypothetical protein
MAAREHGMRICKPLAALLAVTAISLSAPGAAADAVLPIFDTHVHYSRDAWVTHDPGAIIAALEAAKVVRALVSSTPDDGSLRLVDADPDRFVAILRPYRAGVNSGNWFDDPDTPDYVARRLERGGYLGIGEFHLFDAAAAETPQVRRLAAMAVARDIVMHVHSGAAPLRALFAIEPGLKILWGHAGMTTPPQAIGRLLDDHDRLSAELSFRAGDIAPAGRLDPAWRTLLLRHADRFMIGTDTYVASRWDIYGALVDEHRRWLAQLPPAVAEAIAHGNAARRFGAGR